MEELKADFRRRLTTRSPTTPRRRRESVADVVHTLLEAVVLVALV